MNFTGANPFFMQGFITDESSDVKAASKDFKTNMELVGTNAVGTAAEPLNKSFVSEIEGRNAITGNGEPLSPRNPAPSSP
jgi:hypothetical protein